MWVQVMGAMGGKGRGRRGGGGKDVRCGGEQGKGRQQTSRTTKLLVDVQRVMCKKTKTADQYFGDCAVGGT